MSRNGEDLLKAKKNKQQLQQADLVQAARRFLRFAGQSGSLFRNAVLAKPAEQSLNFFLRLDALRNDENSVDLLDHAD